jgi:glycosyltransferase involved in cell wall biosynthesis
VTEPAAERSTAQGNAPGAYPDVEVILPCLNEVEALGWVLPRIPEGITAIVVDNGSTDGTGELAVRLGARVVVATQRGYGAACHAGLLAATAAVVAVMDADASLDPKQLTRVVDPVLNGRLDLVLGRREAVRGAFPWQLRVANRALASRIRRRTGVRISDLGPMRAARREPLLGLRLEDRRSGYPAETVVRAADAGWRIGEVGVDYLVRRGRSKVTGTPLGVWHAVRDMSAAIAR